MAHALFPIIKYSIKEIYLLIFHNHICSLENSIKNVLFAIMINQ